MSQANVLPQFISLFIYNFPTGNKQEVAFFNFKQNLDAEQRIIRQHYLDIPGAMMRGNTHSRDSAPYWQHSFSNREKQQLQEDEVTQDLKEKEEHTEGKA